ncbi:MAG: PDZ domain-containing protein [Verrucomicrobiae bacterium]|nr:PDZ domain-containing protein [Verrucomicrobiae bacterium]
MKRLFFITGWLWLVLAGMAVAAGNPAPSPMDVARALNQAFTEVADKVSESVVVIKVAQRNTFHDWSEGNPFLDMLPREWRRRWEERRGQQAPAEPRFNGQGSGLIIREDGYLLTNFHVVENAEKIRARLHDGREFDATLRGADAQSDLAVLKIEATGLKAARWGDSSATKVGEFAIAVGAPFDLEYTVTVGHISAKGRSRILPDPSMDQDFLQTDANINPGNSGGPLVNLEGEVIGINTMIAGLNTGIGFAIPSNLAREVAAQLIAHGKYTRSWLGVAITSLREDPEYRNLVKGVKEGVIVREIVPGGPAAKAELRPADIITAVDGRPVTTSQQLRNEIRAKPVGREVTLDVYRKDRFLKIKVRPEAWPEANEVAAAPGRRPAATPREAEKVLGLTVEPLTPELARKFAVQAKAGVVVTAVAADSPAAEKEIKPGDVITEVDHQPVRSLQDFREALKSADSRKGVVVNFLRGGSGRFVILKNRGD